MATDLPRRSNSDWLRGQPGQQPSDDAAEPRTEVGNASDVSAVTQPRATRRLAENRVSLPGARQTVYSHEHGSDVQIDPWFAPDGAVRGGVLILPDGTEQVADAATVASLLGEEGLAEARRRLGLLTGASPADSEEDDEFTASSLPTAPQQGAFPGDPDSDGISLMPESFPMHAGAYASRQDAPSSGDWGFDERYDGEHALVSGMLARNAGKALRRIPFGWEWLRARFNSRALPPIRQARQAAAQVPWPVEPSAWRLHRGVTTRRTRIRNRLVFVVALTILLVGAVGLSSYVLTGGRARHDGGVGNLPGNLIDANATLTAAEAQATANAQQTAIASATIASGGIPPTPLPTTPPAPTPTSGSGFCLILCGGGGNPTTTPSATATPSATNTPGPTPTATPNPFAPSASVSFTRSSSAVNAPSTLVTYDGANDDASGGSTRGQKLSAGPLTRAGGSWGTNYQQTQGASATILYVQYFCTSASHDVCIASAGQTLTDLSGGGNSCTTLDDASADTNNPDNSVRCQLGQTGPITPQSSAYNGERAPCGISCSASWGQNSVDVLGTNPAGAHFTPNPCSGDGGAAARSNLTSALASGLSGGLGADAIAQQTSVSANGFCAEPDNCAAWSGGQNVGGWTTYTMCASGSAWKLTYSPSGAQGVQRARLVAPSGYALDSATISVCGSVSVQSTDIPNQRATLSCPASATARYVWTQTMIDNLKGQLASKTPAQAQAWLDSTTGVGGSVSVSIPSGYTSLPTNSSAITLTVN
jgi:hypothetical protein